MTRGLGGHSPANVTHHLKGVDFPADKQTLVQQAEDNGADGDVLDVLNTLPDADYETMADVMKAYGDVAPRSDGDRGAAGSRRSRP